MDDLLPDLGPQYDPPYDSPIEDTFAYHIVKYLDPSVAFKKQVTYKTMAGAFRIDFVAAFGPKKIGFECDGEEYHKDRRRKDTWRDAILLHSTDLGVIYRIRGSDIHYHIDDCLYTVARWDPEIFKERGLINLYALASDRAKDYDFEKYKQLGIAYIDYGNNLGLHINRNTGQDPLYEELYCFVLRVRGGNLESIMEQYYTQGSRGAVK